jgi:hypothetical protein
MKEKTKVFEAASSIVDAVLQENANNREPSASCPVYDNMKRNCNRIRQRLRPMDPRDLDFELDTKYLESITHEAFIQEDIRVRNRRHFLMATDRQLQLLSKADTWYIDGTFKIVAKPFTQLLSIHRFIVRREHKAVALMSGKHKKDYRMVLQKVLSLLPGEPDVTEFVVDFEAAIWAALRSVFDELVIKGYAFHWGQALWRKVQEVGLQAAYTRRDDVFKLLRKVFALPYLPPTDIPDAFQKLRQKATTPKPQTVMTYVHSTWIVNPTWPVSSWGVFNRSIRTNNDCEGWHYKINKRTKKANAPFYRLLQLLYDEARAILLHVNMVKEGKLQRHKKKRSHQTQGKLFALWKQYAENSISVSGLLRKCSAIYGPVL